MNVADVIRKAQRRFGDSANILITSADFYDFINDAQLQIVRKTGDVKVTFTGDGSTFPYTLPSGFISGERLEYGGSPLSLIDQDDLDALGVDETLDRSEPYYYYYNNGQILLYPDPPDADVTPVVFTYRGVPTTIASLTTLSLPEIYHEDIVEFVTARCHERNENWGMYEKLMGEFNSRIGDRMHEAFVRDDTYTVIRDDPNDYEAY